MNPNVPFIIISVFASLLVLIFCVSFSKSLAKMKGRSKAWGMLGFFLGPIGLVIVCFLKSKRDDNLETNPIKHLFSKVPSVSRKTIGMLAALAVAAATTIVLYDLIPVWIQNYEYEKQITKENVNTFQPKLINEEVERVFASDESSYVITKENNLYCFGRQHANSIVENSSIIFNGAKKVMSNESECFILDNENKLLKWSVEAEDFEVISQDVVDFSISESTLGFIKTDGKLYMMGSGAYGQLGTYNNESKSEPVAVLGSVVQVVCEADFTVALQKSGDAVVFGANTYGQFAKTEPMFNYPLSIHSGVKQIAAGDGFILLLDNSGNVLSCGQNDCGQLGNGTNENGVAFTQVMTGVTKIDANKKSAFALNENGELFAWGQNTVGQLGTKNRVNQNLPVKVYENVADFDTSGLHTVVIESEGKVHSTGFNNCGQLGRGNARDSFSQLVTVKIK